ncbi:MAG: hypothetical protein ABFC78_09130, partial [Methanoregula sp.]
YLFCRNRYYSKTHANMMKLSGFFMVNPKIRFVRTLMGAVAPDAGASPGCDDAVLAVHRIAQMFTSL